MCGFLLALIEQERPMGFICISPVMYEFVRTAVNKFLEYSVEL